MGNPRHGQLWFFSVSSLHVPDTSTGRAKLSIYLLTNGGGAEPVTFL